MGNVLRVRRMGNFTIEGKIVIFKSLAISKIVKTKNKTLYHKLQL